MTDESVFTAALAIASPSERAAYLDRACAGNPALRREVEELLAAHAADNPLDRPPADLARTGPYSGASEASTGAAVGDRVGPYKLREKIGEGGMGEVWVADQQEPIKRRVALKLIKPGMDSRGVLARFEVERQALAVMDHPNIAKVLDAGTTTDGRPFFVMELVKGTPITEFCDANKLSPRARLELFVPVCQAIQHAHMKGIIHRDIKPSNVLVELYDDRAVAKVINFGVAKAVGQQLTDKTLYTGFGALIGTPAYMAPEQATFNALDIDTRADVYALGVLLYELLAGSPPVEPKRLKQAALEEVLRIVRDEEPPRPSQRLSTSEAKASIAAVRQSDPARLSTLLRGELDWIVMKCLEKDRTRRYDTATALAKDVQRYLSGDAVEACPPTLGYRLRKLYRKNRAAVWVAVAFLLVTYVGASGIYFAYRRATTAESTARSEQEKAEAALDRLTAEEQKVRALLAESEAHRRGDEVRLASADIDLVLKMYSPHDPHGLLRLADIYHKLPRHAPELREFVAMALIARGQTYAPLLPPVLPDGKPIEWVAITPDGSTLFTADAAGRLWDTRTGRPSATLAESGERAVRAALSRDGRVAVTVAPDGVARFWDVPSGRFRARSAEPLVGELRDAPEQRKEWLLLGADGGRLLAALPDPADAGRWEVTVWDTATGRRLACLGDGRNLIAVALRPDGRQAVTGSRDDTFRVWETDTGRVVSKLGLPETDSRDVVYSPSGRHAAVRDGHTVTLWDATKWDDGRGCSFHYDRAVPFPGRMWYLSDDVLAYRLGDSGAAVRVVIQLHDKSADRPPTLSVPEEELETGRSFIDGDRYVFGTKVFDAKTAQEVFPPAGKVFHPDLARFAHDGRWYVTDRGVYDLATGKLLQMPNGAFAVVVPGIGFAGAGDAWWNNDWAVSRVPAWVPLPARLPPDDDLVLWAHVVARGELDPATGAFRKWDEPTWERKRQELAARPVPFPDFPLPGRVAADRLYWLRRETDRGEDDEWHRLLAEMARRTKAAGEADEAAYWTAFLRDRLKERGPALAPPPRVKR